MGCNERREKKGKQRRNRRNRRNIDEEWLKIGLIHFYNNNFETIKLEIFEPPTSKFYFISNNLLPQSLSFPQLLHSQNLSSPSISSTVTSTELLNYPSSPLPKNF
ncbi:hypothetical protein Glove_151g78 [Diversispora epigaea]|uniref:Uncharacterized protein n=1 Tax=Diversispora epigaea TaxID=1348612 RepID=A0A397J1M0_9GLOM|nr:hypothetical protein Glove_151g78 [Diversispora epigaea]